MTSFELPHSQDFQKNLTSYLEVKVVKIHPDGVFYPISLFRLRGKNPLVIKAETPHNTTIIQRKTKQFLYQGVNKLSRTNAKNCSSSEGHLRLALKVNPSPETRTLKFPTCLQPDTKNVFFSRYSPRPRGRCSIWPDVPLIVQFCKHQLIT